MRDLTEAELAWLADSVQRLLRQLPQAAQDTGFDDPPDGFTRELRAALPC